MPDTAATKPYPGQRFWNRFANRYAARALKDPDAYQALLDDVLARLRPTDRVLEIGCGTGGTAIALAPFVASYTASDFSAEMLRIARAKPAPTPPRFVLADARTALAEGPFDVVCAFAVLHLVDDLPDLLARIHAQLPPGGLLITKTWCFADLPLKLRLLFRLLRGFGLFPPATLLSVAGLHRTLQDAGLETVDQRIFGANPQNPYIVARKPAAVP